MHNQLPVKIWFGRAESLHSCSCYLKQALYSQVLRDEKSDMFLVLQSDTTQSLYFCFLQLWA